MRLKSILSEFLKLRSYDIRVSWRLIKLRLFVKPTLWKVASSVKRTLSKKFLFSWVFLSAYWQNAILALLSLTSSSWWSWKWYRYKLFVFYVHLDVFCKKGFYFFLVFYSRRFLCDRSDTLYGFFDNCLLYGYCCLYILTDSYWH